MNVVRLPSALSDPFTRKAILRESTTDHPIGTLQIMGVLRRRQRQIDDGFSREWEEVDAIICASATRVAKQQQMSNALRRLGKLHRNLPYRG